MLINFSVSNFMSLKNEVDLSMETGQRLRKFKDTNTFKDKDILKSVLLVGPNGAGKTNVFSALHCMKFMILHPTDNADSPLLYSPFLMTNSNQNRPTKFSVIFEYDKKKYKYSFSYLKKRILSESLDYFEKSKEKNYFLRENGKIKNNPKSLDSLVSQTRENSLFLDVAQKANDAKSINVFKWFKNNLLFDVDIRGRLSSLYDVLDKESDVWDKEKAKKKFLKFLQFADINIEGIDVRPQSTDILDDLTDIIVKIMGKEQAEKYIEKNKQAKELYIGYKKYDNDGNRLKDLEFIPASNDSKGTQKLIIIALSIINANMHNDDKTIVFDEFDESLHIEISKALMHVFNSKANLNQFILSTHNLTLLDQDLRRDQIYFVEKDFQGETSMYSLFDFKDLSTSKKGFSYYAHYLNGSFGAMPIVEADDMEKALSMEKKSNN